jgi:hypothetical protein
MAAVAEAVPAMSAAAMARLNRAEALRCERRQVATAMTVAELTERLDAIIGGNRIAR